MFSFKFSRSVNVQSSLFKATEIPAELCHGIQGILDLDEDPILPDK